MEVPTGGERSVALGLEVGPDVVRAVITAGNPSSVLASAATQLAGRSHAETLEALLHSELRNHDLTGDAITHIHLVLDDMELLGDSYMTRRCCLIAIGMPASDVAGIADAMPAMRVVQITGGHDSHGAEVAPFGEKALHMAIDTMASEFKAFAVVGAFSGRNATHEVAAREQIVAAFPGAAVTCAHELNVTLGPQERMRAALQDAGLAARVGRTLDEIEQTLARAGVTGPLLLATGDGTGAGAAQARCHGLQLVGAGPVAALEGAASLAGVTDAVLVEVGNHTTSASVRSDGVFRHTTEGASEDGRPIGVGSVDVSSGPVGLQSTVDIGPVRGSPVVLGPSCSTPLSGAEDPALLVTLLRSALADDPAAPPRARFLYGLHVAPEIRERLRPEEVRLLDRVLAEGGMAPTTVLDRGPRGRRTAAALLESGVLGWCGFTVADAALVHATGGDSRSEAAEMGAGLLARRLHASGWPADHGASEAADLVTGLFHRRIAEVVLAALFRDGGWPQDAVPAAVVTRLLDGAGTHAPLALDVGAYGPVVGTGPGGRHVIGAAELLGGLPSLVVDDPAARAIGALAARPRIERSARITAPRRGIYRLHSPPAPTNFYDLDLARTEAEQRVVDDVVTELRAAGATHVATTTDWQQRDAVVDGRPLFVEGRLDVIGEGSFGPE